MPTRLFSQFIHVSILLLAGFELLVLAGTFAASAVLLLPETATITLSGTIIRSTIFAAIMGASIAAMGLYQPQQRLNLNGVAARIIVALFLGTVALAIFFYLFPSLTVGRRFVFSATLVSGVIIMAGRAFFGGKLLDNALRRRVVVFGTGERAKRILYLRRRSDQRGFRIMGFIQDRETVAEGMEEKLIPRPESLYEYCKANGIAEIVVAMDDRREGFPTEELLECRGSGIHVTNLTFFLERETGKIDIDLLAPSWVIFSGTLTMSRWQRLVKRSMDVLASLLMILVTSPLMLIAAIAIRLESRAGDPIFYRQERVGLSGRIIKLTKFRSMSVDAEKDGAQWAQENDSRVTRVGDVLRKYRIDELPQLYNVLIGEMSLVGPRPERPEFVDELSKSIPFYRERHCAVPGMTGWAQLSYPYGATEEDAKQKLKFDLYYVMNRSFLFDIMILLQTIEVVLWKKGSR